MVHSALVGPMRMPLWSALEHMLSVMTPVNLRLPWAAANAATRARLTIHDFIIWKERYYSPGVMRCAVVVPAFMIHTPPDAPVSGSPRVLVVAPGTAMVMCDRGFAGSPIE